MLENELDSHVRSYQPKCTRSRSISEVKLVRAKPVVRWVTTCEALVLNVSFVIFGSFHFNVPTRHRHNDVRKFSSTDSDYFVTFNWHY
jgi:hypothetical protein